MRYLNLSRDDYANMAHENANALRSIGVHCDDLKINKHLFKYETESALIPYNQIPNIVHDYDCVQIFHSDDQILDLVLKGKPKRIVIYHTGTRYRQNVDKYNRLFADYKQITDQTEFMCLGKMDYLAPHTTLKAVPKNYNGKLIIGHYPSNPSVKGTANIEYVLRQFRKDFDVRIDTRKVSHTEQIKRMGQCHVYVELFAPTQNGKPYGCYGVTAFEAAALGCLVITNNLFPKVYEDAYGQCYFHLANDKDALYKAFEDLKECQDPNLLLTPPGFYINHNIESTGYRILELTK